MLQEQVVRLVSEEITLLGNLDDILHHNNPIDISDRILQFLSAMTGAPLDAGLVGNPNDYVFSQTALDNIITQLMEQTGG